MNTLFGEMSKRVEAFDPNREAILAAVPAREEIIDFNLEDQLYEEGIGAKGKSIGAYQPYTIHRKALKQQLGIGDGRTSNVTLKDTGEWRSETDVVFRDNEFEVVNPHPRTSVLKKNWGGDILGLTDQNLDHIKNDFIRPNMQAAFRAKILI